MKTLTAFILFLVALAVPTGAASEESKPGAGARPSPGFERMRSLVGDWKGKTAGGQDVRASYSLISGGSALMEKLEPASESAMITIYHPDGARLMMTHYCSAGNQPRMRADAASADGKSLTFQFVDGTNLAASDEGHMVKLVVSFEDSDHYAQEWTWKGKEGTNAEVFRYERAK